MRVEINTRSTPRRVFVRLIARRAATGVRCGRTTPRAGCGCRRLDSVTAEPLAGTEGATYPFWSPDSQSVAFFASGS